MPQEPGQPPMWTDSVDPFDGPTYVGPPPFPIPPRRPGPAPQPPTGSPNGRAPILIGVTLALLVALTAVVIAVAR